MFDSFFNAAFGPVMALPSPWNIAAISLILTLITTIIYKYTTDQKLMKELKDEMKHMQGQMKEHKHDTKKVMEIQKVVMEKNMKYMMQSFKPMLFTFIPIIFIFGWLSNYFKMQAAAGQPFQFLMFTNWIWPYLIFSIAFSMALRKYMKIY